MSFEVLDAKTAELQRKERLMARIDVKRTILNKGQMAPKGFIFYSINFKDIMGQKFSGIRKISLANEATVGIEQIIYSLKEAVVDEHFMKK
jgi:hypothetical protein